MNSTGAPDDGKLYESFLAGNISSYDELMVRHGDGLTIYLYGYLHDWHDAEDQMIEAFAQIMAKRPRIGDGNFKAYLYKTGRNLAYRLNSRKHRIVQFSFEEYDSDVEGGELVEDALINEDKRAALHVCLKRIEPQLSEALWLVYFEGLSYKEAASVMRVNTKKIDHLLTKGKKRMRDELGKEGITDAY